MRISAVAKSYAKALKESAGSAFEKSISEIQAFVKALSSDQALSDFFNSPVASVEAKFKALDAMSGKFDPATISFLKTVIENQRGESLEGILGGAQAILDQQKGISRGFVVSAQALSDDTKKQLEAKIQAVVQKKIELSYQTNPALTGGVIAHVGGWTFDDSVETQLNKLKDDLNRSAN